MKRFTDNNLRYASIHLDVKKGIVDFSYPKYCKRTSAQVNIGDFYLTIFIFWVPFSIIFIVATLVPINFITLGLIEKLILILIFFAMLILPPTLILLGIFKYYGKRIYVEFPKIQAKIKDFMYGHLEKTYRNIKTKEVIIPYFNNVLLEYEAYGDYAKQLEIVEIKDEKVYQVNGKRKEPDLYWYAKFSFSEIPQTGRLWVKWI